MVIGGILPNTTEMIHRAHTEWTVNDGTHGKREKLMVEERMEERKERVKHLFGGHVGLGSFQCCGRMCDTVVLKLDDFGFT